MKILGIETSCDETSVAVVEDGKRILSNVVATQIEIHKPYYGVVPEIASRQHTEWIVPVVRKALADAGLTIDEIDGIAATYRPGLIGSLLVGLSFAKALAYILDRRFVGVDHILAHLYAPHLEHAIDYPYIGLLVSGGHTIICRVTACDQLEVIGTTIDDACGEAFDKIAKFYRLGYPGGVAIDKLARQGDPRAFNFPQPSLHKGDHRYDLSYSGLKTAVANQLDQFWNRQYPKSSENIAAAFQEAAINMLVDRVLRAVEDTGIRRVVCGGGVSANSCLRAKLGTQAGLEVIFPSMKLCTDNGAMIAGLGYWLLQKNEGTNWELNAQARVPVFRKTYP